MQTRRDNPLYKTGREGFVLLSLLFLVAVIAIQIVTSLPQAAMQAQRIREEKLIYRGEQYERAIQLYFRKHQKYPETINDLEKTNGQRFLRRRYKDPFTGRDAWRLIHMGTDGRITDSLIYDVEEKESQKGSSSYTKLQSNSPIDSSNWSPKYPGKFATPNGRFRGAERAQVVRQYSSGTISKQTAPDAHIRPEQTDYKRPFNTNRLNLRPSGTAAQQQEQLGQFDGNGTDIQPVAGQYPGYSRVLPSRIPLTASQQMIDQQRSEERIGGQLGNGQFGETANLGHGDSRSPVSDFSRDQAVPRRSTVSPMGFGSPEMHQQATDAVGRLLTQPRPGGLQGLRDPRVSTSGLPSFSKGIAGVAIEVEDRGVMVYKSRKNYNEWEFIYDYREDRRLD